MANHYKVVCRKCNAIITQCRCPDKNKEIRWDVCPSCKTELAKEESAEKKDVEKNNK